MMVMGNFEVTIFQTLEAFVENELLYVHHFFILLKCVIESVASTSVWELS